MALHPNDESMVEQVYPYLKSRPDSGSGMVPEFVVTEFADVFSDKSLQRLPPHRSHDCTIPLIDGSKVPYRGKVYNLTLEEKLAMKTWIDEHLGKGLIRPASSAYAAPCFFVKQKGKLRLCMDYRGLNAITVKNRAPLPLISDMLRDLAKAKVFTALDLISAYYQVRMADEDIHKTAFVTPFGQFESLVMLFGLANAPADFQSFMNDVFKDMIGNFVLVYLDDIIIYSEKPEEHDDHVRQVLQRLRDYELYCNLEKCQFHTSSLEYLGFRLTTEGLVMDQNKIASILEWPTPLNKKHVRSFLGFTNFYRKFFGSYSTLCAPLNNRCILRLGG